MASRSVTPPTPSRRSFPAFAGLCIGLAVAAPAGAESWGERCAAEWPEGIAASCEEAVAEDPGDVESWGNLARAYTVVGDDKRLLKAFKSITIVTPDDPMAHFNYGAAAGTLRRYDIAVEALGRALELKPDYVEAELVLSIALEKLGRFDEAIQVKRRAAELGDETAMFELTEAYVSGIGSGVTEAEARAWIERAARTGHIGAMEWMVDIYHQGLLGERPDPIKAEEWRWRTRNAREECC